MRSLLMVSVCVFSFAVASSAGAQNARSAFARDRNVSVVQSHNSKVGAQGVKSGGFTVNASLDAGATYNDNIYYDNSNKRKDMVYRVMPSVVAKSNWSQNGVTAFARAARNQYSKYTKESFTDVSVGVDGRLDTGVLSYLYGGTAFQSSAEGRGFAISNNSASEPVKYKLATGKVGYVHEFSRLRASANLDYKKFDYKDVGNLAGGLIDEDFRDRGETNLSLKAEYAVSPAASVFVNIVPNKISYSTAKLSDSSGLIATVGTNFDVSSLVRGELQIGGFKQNFKNPAYADESGLALSGALEWFPSDLTTISVNAENSLRPSPVPTSSSYKYGSFGGRIDHELLTNLLVSGGFSIVNSKYNGIDRKDDNSNVNIGAKYNLNRNVALNALYNYGQLSSSGAQKVKEYTDNSLSVGVNLAY